MSLIARISSQFEESAQLKLAAAEKLAGPNGTVVLLRVVPPQPDYAESLFSLVGAEGNSSVGRIGTRRRRSAFCARTCWP